MAVDSATAVLEVRDLTCERGGRRLFADLSFALGPGDVLVLRGPNGSGKTSLLRLVAGLLAPAAGRVRWRGRDTRDEPGPWRRAMAFAGHENPVKPALTARENLAFWIGLEGGASVDGALEALGLDGLADLPAAVLSAGQRRRLTLARLAARPGGCWLMDEPEAALDAASAARLADLVAAHRDRGGVTLVATHDGGAFGRVRTLALGGEP